MTRSPINPQPPPRLFDVALPRLGECNELRTFQLSISPRPRPVWLTRTTRWSALQPTGTLNTALIPPFSTSPALKSIVFFPSNPSRPTHSTSHFALPTAQIASPPPGGSTGIAPVDSPSGPTDETVRFGGEDILSGF